MNCFAVSEHASQPNYIFTYFGLSRSLRDRLQDPVSSTRIVPAQPIVDLPLLIPLLTALGIHITTCATLARISQPITACRIGRLAAHHAEPARHSPPAYSRSAGLSTPCPRGRARASSNGQAESAPRGARRRPLAPILPEGGRGLIHRLRSGHSPTPKALHNIAPGCRCSSAATQGVERAGSVGQPREGNPRL